MLYFMEVLLSLIYSTLYTNTESQDWHTLSNTYMKMYGSTSTYTIRKSQSEISWIWIGKPFKVTNLLWGNSLVEILWVVDVIYLARTPIEIQAV